MTDFARAFAWAQDFSKAMVERPFVIRILLRLLMGRYAYREFIGMMDAVLIEGYMIWGGGYGLENNEYNEDPVPFDYGKEREPMPLRKSE